MTAQNQLLREALADVEQAHDLSLDLDHYASRQVLVSLADKIKVALAQPAEGGEVVYGCHCDLEPHMQPDGCVLDEGKPENCVYAKRVQNKKQCVYWKPIAPASHSQAQQPNEWRDMIQERFDVNHSAMPSDPREAVLKLIRDEVSMALDPACSSQAEALIQRGRDEAQHQSGGEVVKPTGIELTDERIDYIADKVARGMPDGIRGFCRTWGWQQFAKALLQDCSGHYATPPAPKQPMTEAEVKAVVQEASRNATMRRDGSTVTRIVRAVEAHHGITSAKDGGAA